MQMQGQQIGGEQAAAWQAPAPRTTTWWLVEPRRKGSTLLEGGGQGRRRGDQGHDRERRQVPGRVNYSGCHKCGSHEHRAVECSGTVEDWLVRAMELHGVEQAKVLVMKVIATAEVRAAATVEAAQQQRWSDVVRGGEGGAQRRGLSEEAKARYARQRQVRQARKSAQIARQKAKAAEEAVRRGEYPAPWASLAEAQAKVKEATAQKRAAMQRQQQARRVQQQQSGLMSQSKQQQQDIRQTAGWALHKEVEARMQQHNAEASLQAAQQQTKEAQLQLTRQRKRQQVRAAKWHRLVDTVTKKLKAARKIWAARWATEKIKIQRIKLQERANDYMHANDYMQLDLSLNSPCLKIPCLASDYLTEQA